ncbi:MAG: NAD(P)-dependent oxidoreductase [Geminicoccaceae bacterium]
MIFASWGMPNLTDAQLASLPKLEAVFYAAGNVKAFAQQLVDHDITLVSAWAINAIPVAEMCLAQILLSLRGYFRSAQAATASCATRPPPSASCARAWPMKPSASSAWAISARGCAGCCATTRSRSSPTTRYSRPSVPPNSTSSRSISPRSSAASYIVSNHIPDLPSTRGTLGAPLFAAMREGATFINTGRGAQVVEEELIAVLEDRTDLTALLDVTWPEPPADPPDPAQRGDQPAYRRHYRQSRSPAFGLAHRGVQARTPAARCATK